MHTATMVVTMTVTRPPTPPALEASGPTDLALLQRFHNGDREAFEQFCARHLDMAYRVALKFSGNAQDAEDAVQAVFVRFLKPEVVVPIENRASARGWIMTLTIDTCRKQARSAARRRNREQTAVSNFQHDQPMEGDTELQQAVRSQLETLPDEYRLPVWMRYLERLTFREIGEALGLSEDAAEKRVSRGIDKLRGALASSGFAAIALPAVLSQLPLDGAPASLLAFIKSAAAGTVTTAGAASAKAATVGAKSSTFAAGTFTKLVTVVALATTTVAGVVIAKKVSEPQKAPLVAPIQETGGTKDDPKASDKAPLGTLEFFPSVEKPVGWRGDGTGRYPGATPPTAWSRTKNGNGYATKGILWATPLPNVGVSCPIIVGQRIYITTEVTELLCLDKQTGRILWMRSNPEFEGLTEEERKADPGYAKLATLLPLQAKANADVVDALNTEQPTAATSAPRTPGAIAKKKEIDKQIWDQQLAIYKKSGYQRYGPQDVFGWSCPTATSDGKHVFVFYETGITACYDLDGNRVWTTFGKGGGAEHGNFASPVLCENQVVVWANELRGYDTATGKLLWKNPCVGRNTYGSPFRLRSGADWVVSSQNGTFARVRDGKAIWNAGNGFAFDDAVSTPVVEGDMMYAHGGYKDEVGFKAYKVPASTDSGKVTPAFTFKSDWTDAEFSEKNFQRSYTASPLFVEGLLYRLTEGGGLIVNNAANGETVYRKVLPMKSRTAYWNWAGASASPTLAGKFIYLMDNQGTTVVVQPGKEYKEVAVNKIEESKDGKDQVQNLATPVFEGTRMYYRTPGYLYCIGDK